MPLRGNKCTVKPIVRTHVSRSRNSRDQLIPICTKLPSEEHSCTSIVSERSSASSDCSRRQMRLSSQESPRQFMTRAQSLAGGMDKEAQENVWVFPYLWANSWEGDQRFRCLMIRSLPQLHKPLLSAPLLVQKSLGCSNYELCPAKHLVQVFLSFFLSTACQDPMCRSHSLPEVKG